MFDISLAPRRLDFRLLASAPWITIGLIVVGIIGRLPFAAAPFVNLEYFYYQSAELITNGLGFQAALNHLFQGFNNPLGSVLAVGGAQYLFGVREWSSRLPSMVAWLIGVGAVYLGARKLWSPSVGALSAAIMGVSPLFWVYGGIAYPDVPFTALITIAMLVAGWAAHRRSLILHVLAAMLLGLSTLTRYNGLLFAPVIALFVMLVVLARQGDNSKSSWFVEVLKMWLLYAVISGAIVLPYLLWTKQVAGMIFRPGFVLVAPNELLFHAVAAVPRLGGYLIWLGAFTLPLAPFVIWEFLTLCPKKKMLRIVAFTLPVNVLVIAAVHNLEGNYNELFGEMRLGWLERLLPTLFVLILRFCLLCAGEISVVGLVLWGKERLWPNRYLALWLLIPLVTHSFYRMTQRYAMFFFPPLAIYLAWLAVTTLRLGKRRALAIVLVSGYGVVYLGVGLFTSAYFANEGHAAADVAEYINANNLSISASTHNPVLANSAYLVDEARFARPSDSPIYETVAVSRNVLIHNAMYIRDVRLLGILMKRYAIVES